MMALSAAASEVRSRTLVERSFTQRNDAVCMTSLREGFLTTHVGVDLLLRTNALLENAGEVQLRYAHHAATP